MNVALTCNVTDVRTGIKKYTKQKADSLLSLLRSDLCTENQLPPHQIIVAWWFMESERFNWRHTLTLRKHWRRNLRCKAPKMSPLTRVKYTVGKRAKYFATRLVNESSNSCNSSIFNKWRSICYFNLFLFG